MPVADNNYNDGNGNSDRKKRGCAKLFCCCCCFSKNNDERAMEPQRTKATHIVREVPYYGDLPEEPRVGKAICVVGVVQHNCSRFAINLTCGGSTNSDIAFHFNPRLERRYVVRNCRVNGFWAEEETTSPVKFDFERGKPFRVDILIAEDEFLVSVNGRHFCAFGFRVPLARVTGIEVEGRIAVEKVDYRGVEKYPEIVLEEGAAFTIPISDGPRRKDDCCPETPFTGLLPEGFKVGWQLDIQGRVKILPHSFYVNLQEGSQIWPHPVVPLHLNPRFRTPKGDPIFVRNAWVGGSWGQEERTIAFLFTPGFPFRMAIRLEEECFSVWVDGQLSGEFKFRCPVEKIDAVYVHGDVVVEDIFMSRKPNELYFNNKNL